MKMTDEEIMAIAIHRVPGAREMRDDLLDFARAILAAAPITQCQYPNCGCTSRATCNFNYDAAAPTERQPAICPNCKEHSLVFGHCNNCGHSTAKLP